MASPEEAKKNLPPINVVRESEVKRLEKLLPLSHDLNDAAEEGRSDDDDDDDDGKPSMTVSPVLCPFHCLLNKICLQHT